MTDSVRLPELLFGDDFGQKAVKGWMKVRLNGESDGRGTEGNETLLEIGQRTDIRRGSSCPCPGRLLLIRVAQCNGK
jgi:hypothetical protein